MIDLFKTYMAAAGDGDGNSGDGNGDAGDSAGDGGSADTGSADTGASNTGDGGDGDGGAGDTDGATTTFYSDLPDDWRKQLAGDDEGRLNDLNRYTSLDKWVESGFLAKDNIRKGEVSTGLPEKPTDEQLSAYREANGVPSTPDGYELKLSGDTELTEMEGEIMKGVLDVAHGANISSSVMSAITDAWISGKDAQIQAMDDQDGLDTQTAERTMRDHWGADYNKNMGAAVSMLNGLPEDDRELVMGARDTNGRQLMSSPYFIQFLADTALKANPMATMPTGGDDPDGTAQSIVAKVRAIFAAGNENTEYWKDPQLQKDYERALEVTMKHDKRKAS